MDDQKKITDRMISTALEGSSSPTTSHAMLELSKTMMILSLSGISQEDIFFAYMALALPALGGLVPDRGKRKEILDKCFEASLRAEDKAPELMKRMRENYDQLSKLQESARAELRKKMN